MGKDDESGMVRPWLPKDVGFLSWFCIVLMCVLHLTDISDSIYVDCHAAVTGGISGMVPVSSSLLVLLCQSLSESRPLEYQSPRGGSYNYLLYAKVHLRSHFFHRTRY